MHKRGMWGMYCWNGLSAEQQARLINWGNLPLGYKPEGDCPLPAVVEITTVYDASPGPRFYCWGCATDFLMQPLLPEIIE